MFPFPTKAKGKEASILFVFNPFVVVVIDAFHDRLHLSTHSSLNSNVYFMKKSLLLASRIWGTLQFRRQKGAMAARK